MLLIAFFGAHLIGRVFGWWGPFFSPEGPFGGGHAGVGSRRGGGSSAGSSRGSRSAARPSRSSGGSSAGARVASGVGRAGGRLAGWHEARRDAHRDDEDGPRWGSWREATRDGWEQGRQRGRERYDLGQERKAERAASRQHWQEAKDAEGWAHAPAERGFVWLAERQERRDTCPRCGHGNQLRPHVRDCGCQHCRCGRVWGPAEADPTPSAADLKAAHPELSEPTGPGDTESQEDTVMTAPTAPTSSVSGEVINLQTTRDGLTAISQRTQGIAERMVAVRRDAEADLAALDAMTDGLTSLDMDPDTLGDIASLREQLQQAVADAQKAETECTEAAGMATSTVSNIQQRHGAIEEAVQASQHPAQMAAYKAL